MLKLLVLSCVLTGLAQSAADQRTLDQADALVEKYCPVEVPPINYEEARKNLELSAGNGNVVYDALLQTASAVKDGETKDLVSTLQETVSPTFAVRKATPLLMAFLLWIVWHFACWFVCCPGCMRCCCCCCQNKWRFGRAIPFQILLWTSFLLLAGLVVALCALSVLEHKGIEQGVQGTGCYSAQLLKDAVAGNPSQNFVGLLPAYTALDNLSQSLEPGSAFLEDVQSVLSQTEELERAVNLVRDMLDSLQFLLGEPRNQYPLGYYHHCAICAPLGAALDSLVRLFDEGVAYALNAFRSEVARQLDDGSSISNLRSTIRQTKAPIEVMKDQILDQVGYFVRQADDGFEKGTEALAGETSVLYPSFMVVFVASLIVAVLGFLALVLYSLWHRGGAAPDPVPVCTSSAGAMCGAYIFAGILFLIGGILILVSMVGGGVCLAMVDFDQQSGETLLESLNVPVDDTVRMALNVADRCMSLTSDSNSTRNVADIIELPALFPTYDGETDTARHLLADLVANQINGAYLVLEMVLATQPIRLADNPILSTVRSYLGNVNMKAMYWPSPVDIATHPVYRLMPPGYYVVSALCDDLTLPSLLPAGLSDVKVPGLNSMVVDGFSSGSGLPVEGMFPEQNVTWDCPAVLQGDCSASNLHESLCEAAKAFLLERKLPLLTLPLFRCRYLQQPGAPAGTKCDFASMTKENGTWINSCVHPNNTVTFFEQDCDISEFEENVRSFDLWFYKIFQYLDDVVQDLILQIAQDLKAIVYLHLVDPVFDLLDGFDCSFMQSFWRGLTDSLCFQAVSSVQVVASYYVWAASFSLAMVVVLYVAWRISRDTTDAFENSLTFPTRARDLRNKVKQRVGYQTSENPTGATASTAPAEAQATTAPGLSL